MNRKFLYLIVILCSISCNSRDQIRREALEHGNYDAFFMGVVRSYTCCYYRLPENMEQVFEHYDNIYAGTEMDAYPISYEIDYLHKHKPRYAYYVDSIFIYDPYLKEGYCVYGHPLIWLEHPDSYPNQDYWFNFETTAYDKHGRYIGPKVFDYEKYKIWTRPKVDAICRYDRRTDSLTVLAGVDKLYEISPEDTSLIRRLDAIKDTVRMYMKENPEVYSYMFPMQLSEKGNPWVDPIIRRWLEENAMTESHHNLYQSNTAPVL